MTKLRLSKTTKIQQTNLGQFLINIPKEIVNIMNLKKGMNLEIYTQDINEFVVKIKDE